jgi:hypothetical protein
MIGANPVAAFVATIVMVAFGIVWYSPMLFGKRWAAEVGVLDNTLAVRALVAKFVIHAASMFVALYTISMLVALIDPKRLAPVIAALLLAGAFVILQSGVVIWEKRSLPYFLVNASYSAFSIFAGVSVVLYWPW